MSLQFDQVASRDGLARFFGIAPQGLTHLLWGLAEDRKYREFEIARRSEKRPRVIRAPIPPLLALQRALRPHLDAMYSPLPHVHGFVGQRSAVTNARIHLRQGWVLRIDLADFFPSIHFGRVRGLFLADPFNFPPDVATALAQLTSHRNELPQGAPTSPVISNLVCRSLDARLARFAQRHHAVYSRYADDLCFSVDAKQFPDGLAVRDDGATDASLSEAIRGHIKAEGFTINDRKTRLMGSRQRQRVTGLVVNDKPNVPRDYVRHLRSILFIWDRYGEVDAEKAFTKAFPRRNHPPDKAAPEFRYVIRGQLQYLGHVRDYDAVYQRLAQRLKKCDKTFVPTGPKVPVDGQVVIAGEGPTDAVHLYAARHALRQVSGRPRLVEVEHNRPKNDSELWRYLEYHADHRHQFPLVGLFDADTPEFTKKIGATGWKHLGNGVVAVLLAPPSVGSTQSRYCIEMLYPEETFGLVGPAGRRLFRRSDFDDEGLSHDGLYRMKHPKKSALVIEAVLRVNDGKSVGLSKVAFAESISKAQPPYSAVDFSGFAPTFDRLWVAVAMAQTYCD